MIEIARAKKKEIRERKLAAGEEVDDEAPQTEEKKIDRKQTGYGTAKKEELYEKTEAGEEKKAAAQKLETATPDASLGKKETANAAATSNIKTDAPSLAVS